MKRCSIYLLALLFLAPAVQGQTRKIPVSIHTKMEKIIIPKMQFRNVTVEEICKFIVEKSRELDPEGVGVNIILMTNRRHRKLTLTTGKASVKRAVELIAASADMNYTVDRNAVVYKTPPKLGK